MPKPFDLQLMVRFHGIIPASKIPGHSLLNFLQENADVKD